MVVGPHEVFGFDAEDGSEVFTAPRDLGPSVTPAIGSGPDGPVVVFADKSKRSGRLPTPAVEPTDESADESGDRHKRSMKIPLWVVLIPAGLAVMCLGAGIMGLLLYLFKK